MSASRLKLLTTALAAVLTPAQMRMACELIAAENPSRPAPGPRELMYWLRLNMPVTASKVEDVIHPLPFAD